MRQRQQKRLGRKFDTANQTQETASELGKRKKLNPRDLVPFRALTDGQQDFIDLFNQNVKLISLHGCAGTGKTVCALAMALKEVFDETTPYEKVVIVRSTVEVRGMGFLPGDMEEKTDVYKLPYKQLLSELMRFNDPYEMAESLGYIEFVPTAFIRGTTFNNSIVIVDECENMDYSELAAVVTRTGINSRAIFIGDDAQSDLFRIRQQSGFKQFREVLERMPTHMVGRVDFGIDDIVRSDIVREFIIAELGN